MAVHYFLGGARIAKGTQRPQWNEHADFPSTAYFCPTCGEIWARILVEGTSWNMLLIPCQAHGGGEFLPPWSASIDAYPLEVLLHDFPLALKRAGL